MNPTATRDRTAIISVSNPRTLGALSITSACGTTYKYVRSMEKPVFAVMVECLCVDGHGTSELHHRHWLTRKDADLDIQFADLAPRTSVLVPITNVPNQADIDIIDIDVLETLTLDQVAGVADSYRRTAALAA